MGRARLSTNPRNVRRRQLRRHQKLLDYEYPLWNQGLIVAGLDEAGAGPLAGPVTAGCVVLSKDQVQSLVGVDDSKALKTTQRETFAEQIQSEAIAWAVAHATVEEIDQINIREAGLLAMSRALQQVTQQLPKIDHLLVDARTVPQTSIPQTSIIKGDSLSLSIAAASILAKVTRDRLMDQLAKQYPNYGFERHKGYGTKAHLEALKSHGVTPIHRRTFEPIHTMLTQLSLFE